MSGVTFLQIEPTTRCNFTCGFCCGRHMDQSDMSWQTYTRMLEQFPELTHLELQGEGEPLLHPQFFDMARWASERGIHVSTITNGSLFTRQNIDGLLTCGVEALLISIESARGAQFKALRGGNLDKVVSGIRALLAARDRLSQSKPSVGFAVTLLNETQDQLPAITDLYRDLGMDGGILFHSLSSMESYVQIYDDAMARQVPSKMGQSLAWNRYARQLGRDDYRESPARHFWDALLGRKPNRAAVAPFESCPWLDKAAFVNRHGIATACPNVKNTDRYALGTVAAEVVAGRDRLASALRDGIVPDCCSKCFIAEAVVGRKKEKA